MNETEGLPMLNEMWKVPSLRILVPSLYALLIFDEAMGSVAIKRWILALFAFALICYSSLEVVNLLRARRRRRPNLDSALDQPSGTTSEGPDTETGRSKKQRS